MKFIYFKKSILYFGVLFMGISHVAYPIGEISDADTRALALGNIKALSRGMSNPAYLAFMEQKELGASVYNRFKMKELNTMSIYTLIPNQAIDAGFLFSSYGYEDYRLLQGQVNLAKKLSSSFSIGTNLTYINENSILEPENKNCFSADIGFYYRINESLEAAFVTENLLHTSSPFPVICDVGILYRLLTTCSVLIETGYDFRKYPDVKAGIEYEIAGQFTVRAGFGTQPKTPSIGFAYAGRQWKTDVAFLLHPILGLSSAIGIACFF
jgi:hypothetical protein